MSLRAPREAFLDELAQLSLKHHIVISACGCCGSPWLTDLDPAATLGAYSVNEDGDRLHFEVLGEAPGARTA